MKPMTRKNMSNIRGIFQERTGVSLDTPPGTGFRMKKAAVLALAAGFALLMAAFSLPLFSGLDGDKLSLSGTYQGAGIVTIQVENHSDKVLRFQEQTKLLRWVGAREVPRLDGDVVFENTEFAPHSQGVMTLDLSAAYDIKALEEEPSHLWYYLLLTNNGFLFGQDWMCSIRFSEKEPDGETRAQQEETAPSPAAEAAIMENISQELRFYFEQAYGGQLMAFNEANFQYQQKVDELLTRFPGKIVKSISPYFMVGGPSELLDPEPVLKRLPENVMFDDSLPPEKQYLLTGADWMYTDGYGRMVASAGEKAWVLTAMLPQHPEDTEGSVGFPVVFLFVYDAQQAQPENYAFLYGQLYAFAQLEAYKVMEDSHYAIYDATELICGDLDASLDYFLTTREDLYCDEAIRRRVHSIRDYYSDHAHLAGQIGYLQAPEQP